MICERCEKEFDIEISRCPSLCKKCVLDMLDFEKNLGVYGLQHQNQFFILLCLFLYFLLSLIILLYLNFKNLRFKHETEIVA